MDLSICESVLSLLSFSDHPGLLQRTLAVDEPDLCVSSQSEKPAGIPETIQIPTDPPAETRPEPRSAEIDGGPLEIQNPADAEGGRSQTRVPELEVDPGSDPETRDRRNESEFEEITSFEGRTTEPSSDPEPAELSRISPAGEN